MFNLQNMEFNLFFFGYCYKFCCCILFWSNKYGKKTHSFIMVSKETCDFEVFKLCICVLMYSTDPWRNSIIYGSGTWTEIHWHLNWFHALSHLVAFFPVLTAKAENQAGELRVNAYSCSTVTLQCDMEFWYMHTQLAALYTIIIYNRVHVWGKSCTSSEHCPGGGHGRRARRSI